jgi:phosphatidylserine/phosphatidylglycerophosphate/cardiolipin synthase-like enzyme
MRLGSVLPAILLVVGLVAGFGAGAVLTPVTVTATTTQPFTTTRTHQTTLYRTLTTTAFSTHTLRETILRISTTTYRTTGTTTVTVTTTTSTTRVIFWSGLVTACFSRVEQCDVLLIELINRTNKSVYVAVYSFTRDSLAAALISAKERGVEVRVVIERDRAYDRGSEYSRLKSAGVDVRLDGNPLLMHHKFMVVDEDIVVTGSYNWTTAAEEMNDENLVIIVDQYVAMWFKLEFERVWQTASP